MSVNKTPPLPPAEVKTRLPLLCKVWARGGQCRTVGCSFRHELITEADHLRAARAREQSVASRRANIESDDPFAEGASKGAHGSRHVEFVRWLLGAFGEDALHEGILDVAGGRGHVAFELQVRHGLPCTLLEPRAVTLTSSQRKCIRKQPADHPHPGPFPHVRALLDGRFEESAEGAALLRRCTLVGMHPDEATEAIVDAALKYGRPFAVLPCCVFAASFPQRGPVFSYRDFTSYLQRKSADIETAFLPFAGRNKVLFRRAPAPPQPWRTLSLPLPRDASHPLLSELPQDLPRDAPASGRLAPPAAPPFVSAAVASATEGGRDAGAPGASLRRRAAAARPIVPTGARLRRGAVELRVCLRLAPRRRPDGPAGCIDGERRDRSGSHEHRSGSVSLEAALSLAWQWASPAPAKNAILSPAPLICLPVDEEHIRL